MHELSDHELLAEFTRNESGAAFAALVARHVNLVYSAALRFTSNPHHAEEITQAVFIILARKAGRLPSRTVISGWLYETARLTAANFVRGEIRRQKREQEAYMQTALNEPGPGAWEQIAPLLDEAMGGLGEADRNAIVLRFFENKTAQETGAALRITEEAAQKRVKRALEKLRKLFTKRGVVLPAAVIAGAMAAGPVQAAPAGLAATVTAMAAKGTSASAAMTTLVKITMKKMTWMKYKFATIVCATALLAGGVATVAFSNDTKTNMNTDTPTGGGAAAAGTPQAGGDDDKLTPQEIATQALAAYTALASYSDSGTIVAEGGGESEKTTFNIRLQRPDFYRIEWSTNDGAQTKAGAVWSDGNGTFLALGTGAKKPMKDRSMALASATGISGGAAASIPGTFFGDPWGDVLKVPASGRIELTREKDEMIGGVDCLVITGVLDTAKMRAAGKLPAAAGGQPDVVTTTRIWIGRKDHLIRQVRTAMEMGTEGKIVSTETHENISVNAKLLPADFAH